MQSARQAALDTNEKNMCSVLPHLPQVGWDLTSRL